MVQASDAFYLPCLSIHTRFVRSFSSTFADDAVFRALQELGKDYQQADHKERPKLPFEEHLVRLTRAVEPPVYLQHAQGRMRMAGVFENLVQQRAR